MSLYLSISLLITVFIITVALKQPLFAILAKPQTQYVLGFGHFLAACLRLLSFLLIEVHIVVADATRPSYGNTDDCTYYRCENYEVKQTSALNAHVHDTVLVVVHYAEND